MLQAKIGNQEFEASLQTLRGRDTDISCEVVEVKVIKRFFYSICITYSRLVLVSWTYAKRTLHGDLDL